MPCSVKLEHLLNVINPRVLFGHLNRLLSVGIILNDKIINTINYKQIWNPSVLNEVSLGSRRPPEKADTLIDEHMQRLLFFMYLFVLFFFLMNENQSHFCPEETDEEPLMPMEPFYSTKVSLDY